MTDLVVHLDRSTARLAAPRTGVLYEGKVARVHRRGDGLRYPWGEEHRDAQELARVVEQLPGKPVVAPPLKAYGHPEDLLKNGAQHRVVGKIISARVDGDHAVCEIFISDADTLKAIEDGVDELSLGYACRADENGNQFGTFVDHLAVVPRARCGASCALRTDGEAGLPTEETMRTDEQGTCTCQSKHDGNLTAKQRHEIPANEFADPATHQEPLENEGHVRAAMSRFGQTHFPNAGAKRSAFHHILSRAHALGIDAAGFEKEWQGRLDQGCDQGCTCKNHAIGHSADISAPGAEVQMNELEKKIAELTEKAAAEKVRADQAEAQLQSEKTRADQAVAERDQARVEASNAKKDLGSETARADQAEADKKAAIEKARTDAAEAQSALVTAQVKLISESAPIIGKDAEGKAVDLTAMSERAIKVAVVKHVDGDDIGEKESLDYVNGMYAGALKRHAKSVGSRADARSTIVGTRRDAETTTKTSARDAEKAALDAMNHDTSTAYLAR